MREDMYENSIMVDDEVLPFLFSGVDLNIVKIFLRLSDIHKMQLTLMNRVAKKYNIYQGQLLCLKVIGAYPSISQTDMAKRLHLKRSTITSTLKSLEKLHLIERVEDQNDHRVLRVNLTAKGKEIVSMTEKLMSMQLNTWHSELTSGEIQQILQSTEKILHKLKLCYNEYLKEDGEASGK